MLGGSIRRAPSRKLPSCSTGLLALSVEASLLIWPIFLEGTAKTNRWHSNWFGNPAVYLAESFRYRNELGRDANLEDRCNCPLGAEIAAGVESQFHIVAGASISVAPGEMPLVSLGNEVKITNPIDCAGVAPSCRATRSLILPSASLERH